MKIMMTSQTFLIVFSRPFIHFNLNGLPLTSSSRKGFKVTYSLTLFPLFCFPPVYPVSRGFWFIFWGRATISRHPHLNKTPHERDGNALFCSFSFLLFFSTCPSSKMSFDFAAVGFPCQILSTCCSQKNHCPQREMRNKYGHMIKRIQD